MQTLFAFSLIGAAFVIGLLAGRAMAQVDADMDALDEVFIELKEENNRLKQRRCECSEHLDDLRRLN